MKPLYLILACIVLAGCTKKKQRYAVDVNSEMDNINHIWPKHGPVSWNPFYKDDMVSAEFNCNHKHYKITYNLYEK